MRGAELRQSLPTNGARDVPARSAFEPGPRGKRIWTASLQSGLLRAGTRSSQKFLMTGASNTLREPSSQIKSAFFTGSNLADEFSRLHRWRRFFYSIQMLFLALPCLGPGS